MSESKSMLDASARVRRPGPGDALTSTRMAVGNCACSAARKGPASNVDISLAMLKVDRTAGRNEAPG